MRKLFVSAVAAVAVSLGLWSALAANAAPAPRLSTPTVNRVAVPRQAAVPRPAAAPSKVASRAGTEVGSEPGTETGSGTETDTHEDPNGQDVQHECPPSCDTVSGEQP